MRKLLIVAVLASGLAACGYSHESFEEDAIMVICQWQVDCFQTYPSLDDCSAQATLPPHPSGCVYTEDNAHACVDALELLTCESEPNNLPPICSNVYVCPDL